MPQFFTWLESTGLARTVGESLPITAWLSAIHMIGFTLVMSAGMIWNLYASGALLADAPPKSIAGPAVRLLALGLSISLVTGFALFAPRASYTAPDGVFQLKMALLLAAATYQLAVNSWVLRRPTASSPALRASAATRVPSRTNDRICGNGGAQSSASAQDLLDVVRPNSAV